MTPQANLDIPNRMEREALRVAIGGVIEPERREALFRQMHALRVVRREYTGAGFYTWFSCPPELRSDALSDEAVRGPAAAFGIDRPDRLDALFFLVYAKDGVIDFLEGASGGMWYEDAASAGCWPGTMDPIVFDPALIELG